MAIMGEGYTLLIAAGGKIPKDIQFILMDRLSVEHAKFRVVPFEFEEVDGKDSGIVKCIHPYWYKRFDAIVGTK